MKQFMKFITLYDHYGVLLNPKQQQAFVDYYMEDHSLYEISEIMKISRQAVRELIKRAENELEQFDKKLHLRNRREKELFLITEMEKALRDKNFNALEEIAKQLRISVEEG